MVVVAAAADLVHLMAVAAVVVVVVAIAPLPPMYPPWQPLLLPALAPLLLHMVSTEHGPVHLRAEQTTAAETGKADARDLHAQAHQNDVKAVYQCLCAIFRQSIEP